MKAANAGSGAAFLWFVTYVPAFFVNGNYAQLTTQAKTGYVCRQSASCVPVRTPPVRTASACFRFESAPAGFEWTQLKCANCSPATVACSSGF
jgi:hypothetical protein